MPSDAPSARVRRGVHPVVSYAARRIVIGIALVFAVSTLVFVCTSILPGDAASQMLGRDANPASLARVRAQLGLNRPPLQRYEHWLGGLIRGNLGESLAAHESVSSLISQRIGNTLWLALLTMAVLVPLAVALGIVSGLRPGSLIDRIIASTSLGAISVPEFVVATLLALIFAVKLQLFPAVSLLDPSKSPIQQFSLLVLPMVTLVAVGLAYTTRMVRAGVIEVMSSEYVAMARLNGIPERQVVLRHGVRNGLAATVQVVALNFQWLVGCVLVVETVFNDPGVGQALVQAVQDRDIPFVEGVAVIIATLYIAINIAADLVVVMLIPKLRTSM